MGFLSNLFDPGRGDRQNASFIANQPGSQITGGRSVGGLGVGASFGFDPNNYMRFTSNASLGQLQRPANRAVSTANQFIGRGALDLGFLEGMGEDALAGLNFGGLDPRGGLNLPGVSGNAGQLSGMQQLFQSALGTATADPFQLGAGVTSNLREQALPGQQRAVNSALDRLFASGRLGTTGGAQQVEALANAQNQQDLQFQLAGLEAGRGLQSDAVGRLTTGFGGTESALGRIFEQGLTRGSTAEQLMQGRDSLALASAGLQGQQAGQRFGIGTSMADALLQNLISGHNIGLSGLGAATGLSQLPLQFQQAALQANIARSNANLSRAGVQQTNASMAKSPLLEGINAIGQFFEPIKLGGS